MARGSWRAGRACSWARSRGEAMQQPNHSRGNICPHQSLLMNRNWLLWNWNSFSMSTNTTMDTTDFFRTLAVEVSLLL